MKTCYKCKIPKELDEFHIDSSGKQPQGRQSYCKVCTSTLQKKNYNKKSKPRKQKMLKERLDRKVAGCYYDIMNVDYTEVWNELDIEAKVRFKL